MKLSSYWTRHLPKDKQEDFGKLVLNSSLVLNRLDAIVAEWEKEIVALETDYDCPAWSHRQADLNGYRRALKKVRDLLT